MSAPILTIPGVLRGYLERKRVSFWQRVDKSDGCWEWTAASNLNGYGTFVFADRSYLAHRFAYETEIGPIPDGLTLDHLCRNRACVRPDHLEPVTGRENTQRGDHTTNTSQSGKTHCLRGHPFDEENTYRSGPRAHRQCRACARIRWFARQGRIPGELLRRNKSECIRGHSLSDNVRLSGGRRICRRCDAIRQAESKARQAEYARGAM